uniref:Uncharacterized protein n=1 Tax=Anguilla anguilla TaxID=7936 RepID=A0A0E9XJY0_ANGAN
MLTLMHKMHKTLVKYQSNTRCVPIFTSSSNASVIFDPNNSLAL